MNIHYGSVGGYCNGHVEATLIQLELETCEVHIFFIIRRILHSSMLE